MFTEAPRTHQSFFFLSVVYSCFFGCRTLIYISLLAPHKEREPFLLLLRFSGSLPSQSFFFYVFSLPPSLWQRDFSKINCKKTGLRKRKACLEAVNILMFVFTLSGKDSLLAVSAANCVSCLLLFGWYFAIPREGLAPVCVHALLCVS